MNDNNLSMPFFSIICPVYNTSEYLDECINSVLKQNFKSWELILIDDGSTDNSGFICDSYSHLDKRIKVFHRSNSGQFLSRKYGFTKSVGKYILFLDSDDYYINDALITIFNNIHNDIDVLQFGFYRLGKKLIPSSSNFASSYLEKNTIDDYKLELLCKRAGGIANKCFKRSLIDFDSINDNIKNYSEDWSLTIKVFDKVERFLILDSLLYVYRINEKSTYSKLNFFSYASLYNFDTFFIQLHYLKKWNLEQDENLQRIYDDWHNRCYEELVEDFKKNISLKRVKDYCNYCFFGEIHSIILSNNLNNSSLSIRKIRVLKSYYHKRKITLLILGLYYKFGSIIKKFLRI